MVILVILLIMATNFFAYRSGAIAAINATNKDMAKRPDHYIRVLRRYKQKMEFKNEKSK